MTPTTPETPVTPIQKLRNFISKYLYFAEPDYVIAVALWIAATYLYQGFDAFPYMVITATTKRAGKTRLMELIKFTCQMPVSAAGATAPALYAIVNNPPATILWDEAETLGAENASTMRVFLNAGYRTGQTIPRRVGKEVMQWPTYCPKVFVLIGEVFDTLKDRAINISMRRGTVEQMKTLADFRYEPAKAEGSEIAEELKAQLAERLPEITAEYESTPVNFLTDRDAEIWRGILAIGKVIDPANYSKLCRVAVDLSTLKTAPVKERGIVEQDMEKQAEKEEYAAKLLRDVVTVFPEHDNKNSNAGTGSKRGSDYGMRSTEIIEKLKAIDTAPWRKYQGTGLDVHSFAALMDVYKVKAELIRVGKEVFRGYSRKRILQTAEDAGI
jgi:hypothetical protein